MCAHCKLRHVHCCYLVPAGRKTRARTVLIALSLKNMQMRRLSRLQRSRSRRTRRHRQQCRLPPARPRVPCPPPITAGCPSWRGRKGYVCRLPGLPFSLPCLSLSLRTPPPSLTQVSTRLKTSFCISLFRMC